MRSPFWNMYNTSYEWDKILFLIRFLLSKLSIKWVIIVRGPQPASVVERKVISKRSG